MIEKINESDKTNVAPTPVLIRILRKSDLDSARSDEDPDGDGVSSLGGSVKGAFDAASPSAAVNNSKIHPLEEKASGFPKNSTVGSTLGYGGEEAPSIGGFSSVWDGLPESHVLDRRILRTFRIVLLISMIILIMAAGTALVAILLQKEDDDEGTTTMSVSTSYIRGGNTSPNEQDVFVDIQEANVAGSMTRDGPD
mmetsp:Transcript_8370/g.10988  ORF Transcript_8370/g.10988 Transcript_8370/m.10988 type:complete len:196 (-) Transcript_8370:222-809(-)|eukprot:CAMPEP_0198145450 /NCGR_PEP_ID=MMETSP1443-20131203/23573_1 /TAXON_ID=186043 /ORGANISM="Entomoneis sp., Strain CCMP2396" /LENGTH=195 /DNA_ID=CAMNT_0043809105 /DNA_START=11 /DNA_END=598 /DNA_ORIENTATION=+